MRLLAPRPASSSTLFSGPKAINHNPVWPRKPSSVNAVCDCCGPHYSTDGRDHSKHKSNPPMAFRSTFTIRWPLKMLSHSYYWQSLWCVELYPEPNAGAEYAAATLVSHIGLYGTPAHLQSEGGRRFVNHILPELILLVGTVHDVTTAYSHEENGL